MEKNSELFLIDPSLFDFYSFTVKKRVPVFQDGVNLFMYVKDIEPIKMIDKFEIIQKEIDLDLLNEKIFLIKNYKKWIEEKSFTKESPIRSIIDFILTEAILNNISDIHFGALNENDCFVKFKKDTILSNFCVLTKAQFDSILLCLKILSSLDTSKRHLPQSSSFSKIFKGELIDFRVSTHPTFLGERFVLRTLAKKNVLNYREMNLNKEVLNTIEKIIDHPNGLVIFTGPTNSGKTTLIHSIIREICKKNLTIMTLEDPVEYKIPGIIQTNVTENGLTFYEGMRSILRQDPDVIFLGEIRDSETAKIAIQASLTGHKILTTLHAYSVKGAVTRLLDMGISNIMLAESLIGVFAQRLVRKSDGKGDFLGLTLLVDSLLLDETLKDHIRVNQLEFLVNKLRSHGEELVSQKIITESELKRVLG